MKKLLTALLSLTILVSLTGCGSSGGTLIMATNAEFPPYEYYDGDKIVGIDVEIAQAIADDLGMKIQVEDMAFESIIFAVQSGNSDIGAAGLTVDEERLESVNFTNTYAKATQVIIVKEDSPIKSPDELEGKTIGVQIGTTGAKYAEDIADASVELYNKGFEAVQALKQEKVEAVIIDIEPAKVFLTQTEGLKMLDEAYTDEEYAIIVAKENTELLDKINKSLDKLKESGKLQEIIDKYIPAE